MALTTRADVVARVSNRGLQAAQLTDDDVTVAELRYIKPALGATLYAAVVDGAATDYTTLVTTYITPALSWFTLFVASDRLMVEVADRGMMRLTADNAQPMSEGQRTSLQSSFLNSANTFMEAMIDYIVARVAANDVLYKGLYTVDSDMESKENAVYHTSNAKKTYHI